MKYRRVEDLSPSLLDSCTKCCFLENVPLCRQNHCVLKDSDGKDINFYFIEEPEVSE